MFDLRGVHVTRRTVLRLVGREIASATRSHWYDRTTDRDVWFSPPVACPPKEVMRIVAVPLFEQVVGAGSRVERQRCVELLQAR